MSDDTAHASSCAAPRPPASWASAALIAPNEARISVQHSSIFARRAETAPALSSPKAAAAAAAAEAAAVAELGLAACGGPQPEPENDFSRAAGLGGSEERSDWG
jgi:hypothetical protein